MVGKTGPGPGAVQRGLGGASFSRSPFKKRGLGRPKLPERRLDRDGLLDAALLRVGDIFTARDPSKKFTVTSVDRPGGVLKGFKLLDEKGKLFGIPAIGKVKLLAPVLRRSPAHGPAAVGPGAQGGRRAGAGSGGAAAGMPADGDRPDSTDHKRFVAGKGEDDERGRQRRNRGDEGLTFPDALVEDAESIAEAMFDLPEGSVDIEGSPRG